MFRLFDHDDFNHNSFIEVLRTASFSHQNVIREISMQKLLILKDRTGLTVTAHLKNSTCELSCVQLLAHPVAHPKWLNKSPTCAPKNLGTCALTTKCANPSSAVTRRLYRKWFKMGVASQMMPCYCYPDHIAFLRTKIKCQHLAEDFYLNMLKTLLFYGLFSITPSLHSMLNSLERESVSLPCNNKNFKHFRSYSLLF